MVYHARITSSSSWDLEAPDNSTISADNDLPFSESDPEMWRSVANHATQNQLLGEAIATVATGVDVIDDR